MSDPSSSSGGIIAHLATHRRALFLLHTLFTSILANSLFRGSMAKTPVDRRAHAIWTLLTYIPTTTTTCLWLYLVILHRGSGSGNDTGGKGTWTTDDWLEVAAFVAMGALTGEMLPHAFADIPHSPAGTPGTPGEVGKAERLPDAPSVRHEDQRDEEKKDDDDPAEARRKVRWSIRAREDAQRPPATGRGRAESWGSMGLGI